MITQIVDTSVLTQTGCRELLNYGAVYSENDVRCLLEYLAYSAHQAPMQTVHSRLGWIFGEKPVFLSQNAIAPEGAETTDSTYIGQLDLKPKGSLKQWKQMIQDEVIGNTPLTFVMLLGFASMLLGYLNHFLDLGCMVFNLHNTSSKGKTTAAMLAASIWGNPSFDKGFITTMNGTQNSLVAFISQREHETGTLTDRVLSKLAVIFLAATYTEECFNFGLDKTALMDYLLSLEQAVLTDSDPSEKALDCIVQYVSRHSGRFLKNESSDIFSPSSVEGKIEDRRDCKVLTVLKTVVEQILTDNGFENLRAIYHMWQEKKILESEKDRPYKRVRLDKQLPVQPCFVIKIL